MSWRLKYSKQAQKDSLKLASAGLKGKTEKLLTVLPNPTAPTWKEQLMHLTLRRGIRFEAEWVDWCDEALHILKGFR
jgi:Virulence activator alpha C-term